jgi:hypothetical protein
MSDNGCQPTSTAFMQVCSNLGIQQAFRVNWLRVLQTGLTSCSIGRNLNSPVRINLLHMRPAHDAYHRQKSRQHAHPCTIV